MIAIDIFVIILLLACIGYGIYDGGIKIFCGFVSIIVGSLVAGQFYVYGSQFLPQNDWTLLFSFALLFLGASLLAMLIGRFFGSVFEKMLPKPVDKILGALFTLFLGVLILGMIYSGMSDISPKTIDKLNAKNGKVVQFIVRFDNGFFDILPEFFQKKLSDMSPKLVEQKIDEKVEDIGDKI